MPEKGKPERGTTEMSQGRSEDMMALESWKCTDPMKVMLLCFLMLLQSRYPSLVALHLQIYNLKRGKTGLRVKPSVELKIESQKWAHKILIEMN